MIEFTLHDEYNSDLSLNSRSHWAKKAKAKAEIQESVRYALLEIGVRNMEPFNEPVEITIKYNTKLDIDNHGFISKCIIDGIRYMKIISDDTKKYVPRVVQERWNGDGTLVTIRKYEESS